MSLGGIAIAIGAMVDAAIVMIENAHKHLERLTPRRAARRSDHRRLPEVGPALFFSLLIITVSFLPVFALEAQEGRLFKPLAFTKTFAMAGGRASVDHAGAGADAAVRSAAASCRSTEPGRPRADRGLPPGDRLVLRCTSSTLVAAVAALLATAVPGAQLGSEFMPTLNEGTLLYMPASLPALSATKAAQTAADSRTASSGASPRSDRCSARRAAPTPPPTRRRWRCSRPSSTSSRESEWRAGMTVDKLIAEMDRALQFPRRRQRLDHADQGAHRHARHRHPHAGRHQGVRPGPGADRDAGAGRSRRRCARCRAPPAPTPSGSPAATTSTIEPDRARLARYGVTPRRAAGRDRRPRWAARW
ncbi:MAG: hypothetical protein KatS3mg126_0409 [Lysobacteraceae bacterium]|nr:MAG: hypothetical protein KatS3mg126_0409 [Xanthomonadaceae bacterium]